MKLGSLVIACSLAVGSIVMTGPTFTAFAATGDPIGALELVESPSQARVHVSGWAYDPNSVSSSVSIDVYVGGPIGDPAARGVNVGPANLYRPDVGATHPGIGNHHGFVANIPTTKTGQVPVYVYAINLLGTPGNTNLLGTATITVAPDTVAPVVVISKPATRWTLGSIEAAWYDIDDGTGTKNFDGQIRAGVWNGSMGKSAAWFRNTPGRVYGFFGTPGTTYCMQVRGRDQVGNTGANSAERCTAMPLGSGQLLYTGGWTTIVTPFAYRGAYRVTWSRGASMNRSGIVAKHVALVVTKCPNCGALRVYWNGVHRATINLYSPTWQPKQTVEVLSFASQSTGTLRVTVATTGKRVIIEGLGVSKV